jgi:hypothetical protein
MEIVELVAHCSFHSGKVLKQWWELSDTFGQRSFMIDEDTHLYFLIILRVHTYIGSGVDTALYCIETSIAIVHLFGISAVLVQFAIFSSLIFLVPTSVLSSLFSICLGRMKSTTQKFSTAFIDDYIGWPE